MQKVTKSAVVDEAVVVAMLKEICATLLAADVNVKLVFNLRKNIRDRIKFEDMPAGMNKRKAVQKAVTDEIIQLLDVKENPSVGNPTSSCLSVRTSVPSQEHVSHCSRSSGKW